MVSHKSVPRRGIPLSPCRWTAERQFRFHNRLHRSLRVTLVGIEQGAGATDDAVHFFLFIHGFQHFIG